jgi:hypothetical protein
MTRKDYQTLAMVFLCLPESKAKHEALELFCAHAIKDNPRFNKALFMGACTNDNR